MNEEKNKVGRPLKFKTPEELDEKIQAYFESCFEEEWFDEVYRDEFGNRELTEGKIKKVPVRKKKQTEPFTITGLAVALDTDRKTLINYEKRDEFFHTIKKAKTFIENYTEKRLYGNNVAGVIFSLKNNYGWKEKTELEHSGSIGEIDKKNDETKRLIEQWQNGNKQNANNGSSVTGIETEATSIKPVGQIDEPEPCEPLSA